MQSLHASTNSWQVIPLAIADQQQHIEYSEKLLSTITPGAPGVIYWSQAEPDGLVLGFSQKPEVLNQQSVSQYALPVYHRRAGGTAVLVGSHLLSLDVALPAQHPLVLADVVESYRWFGETWVKALALLGVQTRTVPPDEAHAQRLLLKQPETRDRERLLHRACYGTLSPYEVAVDQRKVVGLDMIRRKSGSLLQAGLLLSWNTELLAQVLGHTPEEQEILRTGLYERAVGLDVLAGRPISAREVIAAFEQVLLS